MKTHCFVGNCVNSFDEDTGIYLMGNAFIDVNDFAVIEEEYIIPQHHNAEYISYLLGYIPSINQHDIIVFIPERDIYLIYKNGEDIHYFYEKI